MSDTVFCYHCRRHHPAADVVLVTTGGVKRWRCRQSLALARRSVVERDAFGQAVSAANRGAGDRVAARTLPRPVLEIWVSGEYAACGY